ncbi:hypothetical protein NDU88_006754 [Pleurodeles waltl]|uniref:Uncharacterized protein n=1 Tax=Pleurodeles waltl TaxID=8319 RepID=A0AAV7LQJ2_PLEWA|nr:hypothetical protein NDU88_006754 [Pleurodeles waltl]
MGGPDPTVVGPQEPGSEPLSPARQGKTSGACGTPPRAHHGTGEGRRCAAGCWSSGVGPPPTPSRSSHPLPGRSFPSQGPQWAACGPGPAGSLRRHTSPPSPDRGRGFFGSGDKQPKAARQTDPALTDQSPVVVGCRSSGDARAGTTTTTTVHWGREWGGAAASARPLIISVPHGSEASGWPSAAPAGGDRPRRWAPEAVRAGSRGTPQTATRGTQPGAPGRARGGPASPARPPAEAGWRRLGAPAGVPPRQDPGAGGGRDPAAGDRGWSDLGVGGTKGAEATLRRPQPRPGKSPGAIDDRATLRQA